jgi:tRNA dimethylallyltransferase
MTPLTIILGPTASGKEAAAFHLARRWDAAEIVAVDSMKIYRHLDIGTAKPPLAWRQEIPHHCVDLIEPAQDFSVADYARAAAAAIAQIAATGNRAILVGGTALYYKGLGDGLCAAPPADLALRAELAAWNEQHGAEALHARLRELDPAAAAKIHPRDARRVIRALEVITLTGRAWVTGQALAHELPQVTPGFPLIYVAKFFHLLSCRHRERWRRRGDETIHCLTKTIAIRQIRFDVHEWCAIQQINACHME